MLIMALESSCDETAAAIVQDGRQVLSNVIHSQIALHKQYGGVVPEAAAREHILSVNACIDEALQTAGVPLEQIDAFAATLGPGLVGSLLIGSNAAKTLSFLTQKPFLGVNHLYGHVASNFLESDLAPPFLCLLVSGGHTQLIHVEDYSKMTILGETLDDAVGEAYDKVARLMGLPYPGGPNLDQLAQTPEANALAFSLPKAKTQRPFDFSFSGLKTAALRTYETALSALPDKESPQALATLQANMAASFQHTVVQTLLDKTLSCARHLDLNTIAIAGGVSANQGLRKTFQAQEGVQIYLPQMVFCTDNAAMIAASAFFNPISNSLETEVFSRSLA
jgi:N6-L-threonylcarbamoyladenine synthase